MDYVERNKIMESLLDWAVCLNNPDTLNRSDALFIIDNVEAADVAPVVHGKWVYNKNATDWGIGGYVCSECQNKNNNLPCNRVKSVRMFSGAKYCPECGALMQEEDNGEK